MLRSALCCVYAVFIFAFSAAISAFFSAIILASASSHSSRVSPVVSFGFLDADGISREAADSVTDDEDGLLGELDGTLDATQRQRVYACHEAWSEAVSAERSQELHAIISA